MSIHVTRAPTVPLTSYDTKRRSHPKRLFGHDTRCCSTSSERPEFSSKTQSRIG